MPTELLWCAYYFDERKWEVVKRDNTQFTIDALPTAELGGVIQLTYGGTDAERLCRGEGNFLVLTHPSGVDVWTQSDDANVLRREKLGTPFKRFYGMQFYGPAWDQVFHAMISDERFPGAVDYSEMHGVQKVAFDAAVDAERRTLTTAQANAQQAEREYREAQRAIEGAGGRD